MDWKKIAPWNWFKEEQEPVRVVQGAERSGTGADPFVAFRTEIDRLFDETFSRSSPTTRQLPERAGGLPALLRPNVDISEGKKAYTVRAELPGVELDDVAIQIDAQTLVIQAEKRQESDEEDEGYHCTERSYGAVQRVLSLPDDADGEAVEAKFKNGVLKLRIPKRAAKASAGASIEVQQG